MPREALPLPVNGLALVRLHKKFTAKVTVRLLT